MKEAATAVPAEDRPKGIGGWLILPAIGLVASPVLILIAAVQDLLPAFEESAWEALTTPGSVDYHPANEAMLYFALVVGIGQIAFALVLNYLFWNKSRRVPKLFVLWLIVNVVVVAIDTLWELQFLEVAERMDVSIYKNVGREIFHAAVWIPYFLVSKRVRNTFVE